MSRGGAPVCNLALLSYEIPILPTLLHYFFGSGLVIRGALSGLILSWIGKI